MRKLTWDSITVASKIMLPTYVVMFTLISINFTFSNLDYLTQSPGLRYADQVFSLQGWGLMFGASVVIMLIAWFSHRRTLFIYALNLGAICMAIWTGVMVFAGLFGDASLTAWTWPGFVMCACIASSRSLMTEEQ